MKAGDRRALAAAIMASLNGEREADTVIHRHGGPTLSRIIRAIAVGLETPMHGTLSHTVDAAHSAAWDCAKGLAVALESGDLPRVFECALAAGGLAPTEGNIQRWKELGVLPKSDPVVSALVGDMARKVIRGESPAKAIRESLPKGVKPGESMEVTVYPSTPEVLAAMAEHLEAHLSALRNGGAAPPFAHKEGKPRKVKIPSQKRFEALVRERLPMSERLRKPGRPPKK